KSPLIDGVMVAVTARRSTFLENDLQRLKDLARNSSKPVFMWTYTLPSDRSVEILNEAGYPLFTNVQSCARTMRVMADYRVFREQFLKQSKVDAPVAPDRKSVSTMLAAAGPVLTEWQARPLLAVYGIGSGNTGQLARSAAEAEAAAKKNGGAVALKVQSVDIPHKTEAGAVALNLAA